MNRISRPQMFIEIAWVVAKRSTCQRLNVGAVVVVENRIVSIGYNGTSPGEPHCRGNDCPGKDGCHLTIHAEVNALNYVPTSVWSMPKDLYVTHSPCEACCERIIGAQVERLFFAVPYRETEHLKNLRNVVPVYQVSPAGYVMDYFTRELV